MSRATDKTMPRDQDQRERALDVNNSVLVQAPAGSGKTDLLTRRFLRLLGEVDDPGEIVAITFTKAAAAEMRHRILSKLEEASAQRDVPGDEDDFSMETLARRALGRSEAKGWNLLDQPAQLRISTIDSFCREIALQQPMISSLGDGLDIHSQPDELYRHAARRTLEQIDTADDELQSAIEALLLWRDNNWQGLESELVEMLRKRDQWMHDFVLEREPDWKALRLRLEKPFVNAVSTAVTSLNLLFDQVPSAREEALRLARFACEEPGNKSPWALAECAEIPAAPFVNGLEQATDAYTALAGFLQTQKGIWRTVKGLNAQYGFPATSRGGAGKEQFASLVASLAKVPGLESTLAAVGDMPPLHYSEDDWKIICACFTLLRHAAAQLRVVFAETGAVDYIEVAQIAQSVLKAIDGLPSDSAIAVADGIRHILVDEFQDTSRRQHELLRRLIAAWPEREGRSVFVVGDAMQSIYFFRDADAELFPRVKLAGLEIPNADSLLFDPVALRSNFRTEEQLINKLNEVFKAVFEKDDGSGVTFAEAEPARSGLTGSKEPFKLHLKFEPQKSRGQLNDAEETEGAEEESDGQIDEIIGLIRSHLERMEAARANGTNYRIAVLGRTRAVLAPIAEALREARIPFRALELEKLAARPEVLDALALARALLNPLDRVAWLGVLRAPWCGLSLADLHTLTSADNPELLARPVPELLTERTRLLSADGQLVAQRVLDALALAPVIRFAQSTVSLGTWLEQLWLRLGGAQCVDTTARANLDLLWQCLDQLPNGEEDFLGPALNAALDKLTAQPDPAADVECGVQLMTIHKSKGLEFEVVIVPELQVLSRKGSVKLLSWLERGLPPEQLADAAEEVTEFLVAPLQSKGTDRGRAKTWVDREYRRREEQEMRRILYVAATRARDELHLFARPACKQDKDGDWTLSEPAGSLLATAWPALEPEIRQRFEEWKSVETTAPEPEVLDALAASAESNLLVMPSQAVPMLRRLPSDFSVSLNEPTAALRSAGAGINADNLYERHEGGLLSRALGIAVHALLEELAKLRTTHDWEAARAALKQMQPRIMAQTRSAGVDRQQAAHIATQAFEIALKASHDVTGQWILAPHADAAREVRWAGVIGGELRTVQADRVFRGGASPQTAGDDHWWIVDYKTAHADSLDPAIALPSLRALFASQLATYAAVLRKLHGEQIRIHAGLYYPRMQSFDWWEL